MGSLEKRFPHYSKLLYLFPVGYRKEYGEQMLQTLADMLDDPARRKAAVWARTALDFPISVAHQQLTYTEAAMTTMPRYIKQNAVIGAWMLTPFFVFVLLNGFSGNGLHHSFLWRANVLFAWLVLLPSIAILLNLVALLRWIQQQRHASKQGALRTVLDYKYSWPALAIAIIGLGILALVFGHDSVHCITGNPVRELHNPQQTLQCVQRG